MQDGDREDGRPLGALGPEGPCSSNLFGSFCPSGTRLEGEEAGNLEMQTDADQKAQQKPVLFRKVTKKGAVKQDETF